MKTAFHIAFTSLVLSACSTHADIQNRNRALVVPQSVLEQVNLPHGKLAVVIDGNSPDPDDIGATPVLLVWLDVRYEDGLGIWINCTVFIV